MAAWGKEHGSAFDRDFSGGGLSQKFAAWAVNTAVNHGAGWYMRDDQSALLTDPYIVVCNQSAPTAGSKAKFVKWMISTSVGSQVVVDYYLWWDNTTHTGAHNFHRALLSTVNSGSFAYYFHGGPEAIFMMTRIGSNYTYTVLSEFEGIWDGNKHLLEPETAAGTLVSAAHLESGDTGNYLSGYYEVTGFKPHLDANGKLYFSIVNTTGTTYRIDVFKDSARLNKIGETGTFSQSAGSAWRGINPVASSGLGGQIFVTTGLTANANIDCRYLRLELGSGEAATFTAGRYYYLVSPATGWVNYFKVESISGDTLIIDQMDSRLPHTTGAIVGSYPHRFWCNSALFTSGAGPSGSAAAHIPYQSVAGAEFSGLGGAGSVTTWLGSPLVFLDPADIIEYAMMRPWVGESGGLNRNRFYGRPKHYYVTSAVAAAVMQDRRVHNLTGKAYIVFYNDGTYAHCILDTESLS